MPPVSLYQGRQVALLTQHGKETVVAPVLAPALGCAIVHVTGFDTDQLGTFTREIPRPGTQLDAARRKARKGMALSGLSIGLASEGSFGADPFTGMFAWNTEMLVWVDDTLNLEVVGLAQGAARNSHLQTGDWAQLEAFAAAEGFPQQRLVLRPSGPTDDRIHKNMADWESLKSCFRQCLEQSDNQQVFAETDLRAFANPSRMQTIERAARDLLQRLQSLCPACEAPGFWVAERQPGLPCSACRHPTSAWRSEVWTCQRCQHRAIKPREDPAADPRHCAFCNP